MAGVNPTRKCTIRITRCGTHILYPDSQVTDVLLVDVVGLQLTRAPLQQWQKLGFVPTGLECLLGPFNDPETDKPRQGRCSGNAYFFRVLHYYCYKQTGREGLSCTSARRTKDPARCSLPALSNTACVHMVVYWDQVQVSMWTPFEFLKKAGTHLLSASSDGSFCLTSASGNVKRLGSRPCFRGWKFSLLVSHSISASASERH